MIKSIYLVSRAKRTGPINQAFNILSGHKLNGNICSQLVTISPEKENSTSIDQFLENGINTYSLNLSAWKFFFAIPKLRKFLRQNDIDIIHSSGFRANLLSAFMPHRYKKISTQRCSPADIAEKMPKFIRPVIEKIYVKIVHRIDCNVACSEALSEVFKKKYKITMPFVQNGVNCDKFKPIEKEGKEKYRKELGIKPGEKLFIILGGIHKRKNNEMAIRVLNELHHLNAIFMIIGDGPERLSLQEQVINDKIIFTGRTKEPVKYLQTADALISCSRAEGLPNSVLEALSCGTPCILSDIGPHKELIENTKAGTIFDLNDDETLRRCICDAINWTDEPSKVAREIALQKFDRRIVARNYENLYKNSLN